MRLSKLEIVKRNIRELEDIAIETIQNDTLREKIVIIIIINYKGLVILGTIYEGLLKGNWNL